jgi:tRNA pseudouridine55 synthase
MDGVILIDKPAGPTSAEVVRQLKARLGKRARVGHLGTLDPFATGLLPILVGEGTKLAPFLQEGAKQYQGVISLGSDTDTLDPTGEIVRTLPVPQVDQIRLGQIAASFTGSIEQTPPLFSAIKLGGVPLYRLARRGVKLEAPAPRTVHIERLDLEIRDATSLCFSLVCSSGTYVRSLARDIGLALGTVAHLSELRRVRNGTFLLVDAHPLEQVLSTLDQHQPVGLISLRQALADLPEVEIDRAAEDRLRHGDSRSLDRIGPATGGIFKVISRDQLVAVARTTSRITAAIARVFGTENQ